MSSADYCFGPDVWPDSYQIKWLVWSLTILTVAYWVCFMISCFNFWKYLVKGGRWRIFLMSMFYAIVFALLLTRIGSLICFIIFFAKADC